MKIPKIRSILYTTAKVLGDIDAVRKGRVKERIARRITGKGSGRFLGWLHRKGK